MKHWKPPVLSCCSRSFDEVVDAVFDRLDVAVEHRRVGLEAGLVDLARELEPTRAVAFVIADARARRLGKDLGTAARARIHPAACSFSITSSSDIL
jgi:hypothetical protein